MFNRLRPASIALIPLLTLSLLIGKAYAIETGAITITQENPANGIIGNWTLVRPEKDDLSLTRKDLYETDEAVVGDDYTLIIEPPEGTSTQVKLFINGELSQEKDIPQVSFDVNLDDDIRVEIIYELTITGLVSVTTHPPGLAYSLTGPDDVKFFGLTPGTYDNVPVGLWSFTLKEIEGCATPKPQSKRLEEDGRISLHVDVVCDGIEAIAAPDYEKQLQFVTVNIDGRDLVFDDVPLNQWFSAFVHGVAKLGLMNGSKDSRGNYTGKFMPGDNVSLAQLAKVAHEVSGTNENEARGSLRNTRAQGTWFEAYYRSAERLNWQVFRDTNRDPSSQATRAEVVTTILQALDVPRVWPKGELFADVDPYTRYAASIETAALSGVVSGSEGANGRTEFRPNDPINRAELAKMLTLVTEGMMGDSPEIQPDALKF